MRIVAKSLYWLGIIMAAVVVVPAVFVAFSALLAFQLFRWAELHVIFDGDEAARAESKARYGVTR